MDKLHNHLIPSLPSPSPSLPSFTLPHSQALGDYRPMVVFHLSHLIVLDNQRVTIEEKVCTYVALQAAHQQQISLAYQTLTRV